MSFEGPMKDTVIRPTLTKMDTRKPWGHTKGLGKEKVEKLSI